MTSFSQLGDPVCAACLCEHNGAEYAQFETAANTAAVNATHESFADQATIVSVQITIAKKCCIVVNAGTILSQNNYAWELEIRRPLGTDRTKQYNTISCGDLQLAHDAAWEVLDPGTYTYYLANNSHAAMDVYAAWIKAVASDCEG